MGATRDPYSIGLNVLGRSIFRKCPHAKECGKVLQLGYAACVLCRGEIGDALDTDT